MAADTRFPRTRAGVRGHTADHAAERGDTAAWHAFRIANGVAESGIDYALGDAFPHDVLLDETRRRRLQEGLLCRPGSRLAHAASRHRAPPRADRLGRAALARSRHGDRRRRPRDRRARLGRRAATDWRSCASTASRMRSTPAQPIAAGDVPVALAIPAFAKFTYPAGTTAGAKDA